MYGYAIGAYAYGIYRMRTIWLNTQIMVQNK